MIKGKRREMLSAIASSPRREQSFTSSIHNALHPDILRMYLHEMEEKGYVYLDEKDQYNITNLGRQALDAVPVIAGPRQFISKEPYVPKEMTPMRPGADDHKQYKSRGF